jgi:hypothetical protein
MSVTQLETCNTPPPFHSLSPSELLHSVISIFVSFVALSLLHGFYMFSFSNSVLSYSVIVLGLRFSQRSLYTPSAMRTKLRHRQSVTWLLRHQHTAVIHTPVGTVRLPTKAWRVVFLYATLCSIVYWCFGGTYCLHFQDREVNLAKLGLYLLLAWIIVPSAESESFLPSIDLHALLLFHDVVLWPRRTLSLTVYNEEVN